MNILSLIPTSWKIGLSFGLAVCLGLVGGLAAWKGYNAGYEKAEALGKTQIAELQSEHDRAFAEAMAELNGKIRKQAGAAAKTANDLAKERQSHAKTQTRLQRRIQAAAGNNSHAFSSEFVRLWNQAAGAAPAAGGDALPAAAAAGDINGTPGAGFAAQAGLLADDAGVTEADILAFIVYYGKRTKNLEAQVNAWINWAGGLE
jgi:hypothetical protein